MRDRLTGTGTDFFKNFVLLLLLAYAPWHDAWSLGRRPTVTVPYLSQFAVTTSGLMNSVYIFALGAILLLFLKSEFQARRPKWAEGLILVFPLIVFLNIRVMDKFSIIALENSALLALFLLALVRREHLQSRLTFFKQYSFSVFFTSVTLAALLPLLIPVSGWSVVRYFPPIYRYVGWVGEGGALALSALVLSVFGAIRGTEKQLDLRTRALSYCAVVGGLGIIYSNVLRIAMLAFSGFALFACIQVRRDWKRALVFFALFCSSFWIIFHGTFAVKSGGFDRFSWWLYTMVFDPSQLHGLENWDSIVVTNGRGSVLKLLFPRVLDYPIFGHGAGSATRHLQEIRFYITTPLNDYLRIIYELGAVGMIGFLGMIGFGFKKCRKTFVPAVLVAFLTVMISDNMLVYPVFGYGPLMLLALCLGRPLAEHGYRR